MGKRSAGVELFLGDMGSIQREARPSIQREDQLTMETKLEQIAAKARYEPKLRFTSLAHHITRDRVLKSLSQIPKRSAAGVDGQTVEEAKENFEQWIEPMLQSIHRQGYRAPDIRRVFIPKPGKQEKRPLGVPTVSDRALQRSTAQVLSAIYEQDFLPCSFGGRPKLSAHHALGTLTEVISGGPDQLGAGGGFEELLWEPQSRLGPPICRTSSRRSAPDQLDQALVESGGLGRWSGSSERAGNSARWIDQRAIEQRVPPLRARPLVRARRQGSVAGRSPSGALHR